MVSFARRLGVGMAGFAFVGVVAACSGTGQYVWFDQLPQDRLMSSNDYLIDVGDVVNIRVLGHDEMTVRQRVRSDGRIALLLIGEVGAAGKRPGALRAELEGRLKDFIVSPSVVVNIDESQPPTVLLLGEVARPGGYPLENDLRLAHALALGGGLTEYASRTSIYVVRDRPAPIRIRFTFDAVSRNVGRAGEFQLHAGDVVEVE
jgi:polysaccharide export outer membrane protein